MAGKKGQAEKIILAAIALSEAEAKIAEVLNHLAGLTSAVGTDKLLAFKEKLSCMRYGLEDPVFLYIRKYYGASEMEKCPLFNVEGVQLALVHIHNLERTKSVEECIF